MMILSRQQYNKIVHLMQPGDSVELRVPLDPETWWALDDRVNVTRQVIDLGSVRVKKHRIITVTRKKPS